MNEPRSPLVIVVDGIIGSGKTTYIRTIQEMLTNEGMRVVVVKEPVDKWKESGILELFYADMKRWSYTFQTGAYYDRVMENVAIYQKYGDAPDVYILERSCFTDNLFMSLLHEDGFVTELEMSMYEDWCSMWYRVMPYTPSIFLYLRTSIDTCMERIRSRKREGEGAVSAEYQQKLMEKHDAMLLGGSVSIRDGTSVPSFIVNVETDYRNNAEDKSLLLEQITEIIRAY